MNNIILKYPFTVNKNKMYLLNHIADQKPNYKKNYVFTVKVVTSYEVYEW